MRGLAASAQANNHNTKQSDAKAGHHTKKRGAWEAWREVCPGHRWGSQTGNNVGSRAGCPNNGFLRGSRDEGKEKVHVTLHGVRQILTRGWEPLPACLQSPRARTGRGLGAQSVAGGAEITQHSSRGGTISASTGESYGINHRASPTRGGSARGRWGITASGAYASPKGDAEALAASCERGMGMKGMSERTRWVNRGQSATEGQAKNDTRPSHLLISAHTCRPMAAREGSNLIWGPEGGLEEARPSPAPGGQKMEASCWPW